MHTWTGEALLGAQTSVTQGSTLTLNLIIKPSLLSSYSYIMPINRRNVSTHQGILHVNRICLQVSPSHSPEGPSNTHTETFPQSHDIERDHMARIAPEVSHKTFFVYFIQSTWSQWEQNKHHNPPLVKGLGPRVVMIWSERWGWSVWGRRGGLRKVSDEGHHGDWVHHSVHTWSSGTLTQNPKEPYQELKEP